MHNLRLLNIFILLLITVSSTSKAHENSLSELMQLSIEDLNDIKVTSVSRKPESRFKAASSVTVLTQDDIKRSGLTSIPEALRLVPGVNVARVDSNKWSISVRGFNRMFSNKLLVLIDGRTVYTPLVSGVYWDTQDINIEDLDRIEIIKGPGAAMWGSNAVNGVINIITKDSRLTKGQHVSLTKGSLEKGSLEFRHGPELTKNLHYRVYGKHSSYNETKEVNSDLGIDDDWHLSRVGFRADYATNPHDTFHLQGEVHKGIEQQLYNVPGLITAGVSSPLEADDRFLGGHILGKWTHNSTNGTEHKLQIYLDYKKRDTKNILNQSIATFDIDYQNLKKLNDRNELIWGMGYRFFRDNLNDKELSNGITYVDYEPEVSNNNLLSAFIQNQYEVIPDALTFTLGTKLEHNYYTDFEIQPNARIAWYPNDNNTLWAAVSRAIRIPTRSERSLSSVFSSTAGGFIRLSASADRNFDSEKLTAYEIGFRTQPTWWSSFDISTFYNIYDELRTFETGTSAFITNNTRTEGIAENLGFAETYGVELATRFTLNRNWNLFLNYSFLEIETHLKKASRDTSLASDETKSPEQQLNILSRYNLTPNISVDSSLFYVDELGSSNISSYTRFDTAVHWKLNDKATVSFVGQDIFGSGHQESTPNLYSRNAQIGKSIYTKISYNF